jgi:opacity protein-like surface antigen
MINKKVFQVIAASALISVSSFAIACADETANSPYGIIEGGYSKSATKTKGGYAVAKKLKSSSVMGLGLGYKVGENVRSDITFNYRPDFKYKGATGSWSGKQKIKAYNFMLNGFYDFANMGGFTPYIGAGIGMARIHSGTFTQTDASGIYYTSGKTKTNFAYQATVGGYFKLADGVDFNVGYRYVDLGKFNTKHAERDVTVNGVTTDKTVNVAKGNLKAHEFLAGLKFSF